MGPVGAAVFVGRRKAAGTAAGHHGWAPRSKADSGGTNMSTPVAPRGAMGRLRSGPAGEMARAGARPYHRFCCGRGGLAGWLGRRAQAGWGAARRLPTRAAHPGASPPLAPLAPPADRTKAYSREPANPEIPQRVGIRTIKGHRRPPRPRDPGIARYAGQRGITMRARALIV
jgi:hypothetical protein